MSDTAMTFSPAFAQVLIDWDEDLYSMYRTRRHARTMVEPLRAMGLSICASAATRIHDDIDIQLRTGELISRMRTRFLERRPALSDVQAEQFRQFTQVAMVWNELTEEEARTKHGAAVVDKHRQYMEAARAALEVKEAVS